MGILMVALLLTATLAGCQSAREVNELPIVIGMGIDRAEAPRTVEITAQVVKPRSVAGAKSGGTGGSDGGSDAFWNVHSTGETVFSAVRDAAHQIGNRLFMSHAEAIIFGRELAADGIQEHIDFLLRSREMRATVFVFVAQGKAGDILQVKPATEKLPAMSLAKLVRGYGFTSEYLKVNLLDFSNRLMSKTFAPVAPLATVLPGVKGKELYITDLAVFKQARMVGTLDRRETRGLLWVLGKVKGGLIVVGSPQGQGGATLEIMTAKGQATPVLDGGGITMNIKIKAEAGLAEQTTTENLVTPAGFAYLEKALSEAIQAEVLVAFAKSRQLNADVFGFGEAVHKKYPDQWRQTEDRWDEVYGDVKLTIKVESKVRKADLITRPAVPPSGKGP